MYFGKEYLFYAWTCVCDWALGETSKILLRQSDGKPTETVFVSSIVFFVPLNWFRCTTTTLIVESIDFSMFAGAAVESYPASGTDEALIRDWTLHMKLDNHSAD